MYDYTYDAKGLRTQKIGPNNTVTRYHCDDAGRVIAESHANNNVTAQIIWGDKPLARKIGNTFYYYLYNGHGDVVALTDESGNIVNSYTYDEWGNIQSKAETIYNPIRYAGEYFDEESGLYYLRARYYDPSIGRFISKDSVEGQINNPLSLNLYSYCFNNPIRYIDPSGFSADEAEWTQQSNKQQEYIQSIIDDTSGKYDAGTKAWARDQKDRCVFFFDKVGGLFSSDEVLRAKNLKNILSCSAKIGVGLGAKVKILGLGGEFGVKRYYEDLTTDLPKETAELNINIHLTNKLFIGAEVKGSKDGLGIPIKGSQTAFLGIKVGNNKVGWGNLPYSKDIKGESALGGYTPLGGGELVLEVNYSEIYRRSKNYIKQLFD